MSFVPANKQIILFAGGVSLVALSIGLSYGFSAACLYLGAIACTSAAVWWLFDKVDKPSDPSQ